MHTPISSSANSSVPATPQSNTNAIRSTISAPDLMVLCQRLKEEDERRERRLLISK